MIDLTQNKEAFGLLAPGTQAAMKMHGGPYEIYSPNSPRANAAGWIDHKDPSFFPSCVYRVKPQPGKARVMRWAVLYTDSDDAVIFLRRKDAYLCAARYDNATVIPLIEWRENTPLPTLPKNEE